jgi:hypothetical protein
MRWEGSVQKAETAIFWDYLEVKGLRSEDLSYIKDRNVKIRTFSARTAEKIRHPRGFSRAWSEVRCRGRGGHPARVAGEITVDYKLKKTL